MVKTQPPFLVCYHEPVLIHKASLPLSHRAQFFDTQPPPVSQLVLVFQSRIIQSLWKDPQASDAVAQEPLLYLRTVTFTSFPSHFTRAFLHSFFKRFDTEYVPCKIGKECGVPYHEEVHSPEGKVRKECP